MKTKLLGLIACMALISVSQASAATLVGTTTDASGIDGLVVDSVTYDVTFVFGSYNNVLFNYPSPTYLGNQVGATAAATALVYALNAFGVQALDPFPSVDLNLLIPYFVSSPQNFFKAELLSVPQFNPLGFNPGWSVNPSPVADVLDQFSTGYLFAEFAPTSPVPLPNVGASLPGLIIAGGVLAWWRRNRTCRAALSA